MLCAAILEILEMSAILNLALIPEDEERRTLYSGPKKLDHDFESNPW